MFGLSTAIASLALNLFNYGLWDCWIAPYPPGCKESWRNNGSTTCMRGDNASLFQWLFDLIPKWSSILLVTINMVLVYIFVRRQEIRSERWSARAATNPRVVNSSIQNSLCSSATSTNNAVDAMPNLNQSQERSIGSATLQGRPSWQRKQQRQSRGRGNFSRQIAQQSYLYVGALYITWLPVIVLRGVQLASGVTYYWLLVWVALSIPMQGFWNLLVYLRPRWLLKRRDQRMKRHNSEERDVDAQEAVNGNDGGGAFAVARVATYVKDLSVAAAGTLMEGDIPEEVEADNHLNLNEFMEGERTESVSKQLESVLEVDDGKDSACDEDFKENIDT